MIINRTATASVSSTATAAAAAVASSSSLLPSASSSLLSGPSVRRASTAPQTDTNVEYTPVLKLNMLRDNPGAVKKVSFISHHKPGCRDDINPSNDTVIGFNILTVFLISVHFFHRSIDS